MEGQWRGNEGGGGLKRDKKGSECVTGISFSTLIYDETYNEASLGDTRSGRWGRNMSCSMGCATDMIAIPPAHAHASSRTGSSESV
jgi:hypothetical protein